MIRSISVTNYLGESITLPLDNPWNTGLAIEKIDGLGPERADMIIPEIASLDGAYFNYARIPSREINLSLLFVQTDNSSIEDARHLTYKYFALKQRLRLTIHTDHRNLAIEGWTKENSPDIFSKTSGTSITIVCPDPFFYAVTDEFGANPVRQETDFTTVNPAFEFEFENPWGYDDTTTPPTISRSKSLIFSEIIYSKNHADVEYTGDGDEGLFVRIVAIGDITNLRIINTVTGETFILNCTIPSGYIAEISMIRGQKYAELHDAEDNFVENLMPYIPYSSDWLVLSKGVNKFRYTSETSAWLSKIQILNRIKYEGI